jgi:LysM repeat protein
MSKFDKLFRDLAVQLIDNTFGTPATLVQEVSTYDPNTGDNTKTQTQTTISISPPTALSAQRQASRRHRAPDGMSFEQSDLITTFAAAKAPEPNSVNTKMIWRGTTYQIISVNSIVSGDQDAAYEVVIRA